MKFLAILCLILSSFIVANEEARVRIGRKFVTDIFHIFMPNIVNQINNISSLNYDIDQTYLGILPIHIKVRDFTIEDCFYNISQYSINFNEISSSIDIEINNFKLKAHSKIFSKILFFSNSTGLFNASMNLNLKISISLSTDTKGKVKLGLKSLYFSYQGSEITFVGGFLEWNIQGLFNVIII